MKLRVLKCYDKGRFRVRMAMGLQMRLTIACRVSLYLEAQVPARLAKHPCGIQPSFQNARHQPEVKSQQHLKIYCNSFRKYINSLEILNPTGIHESQKLSGDFSKFSIAHRTSA